MADGGNSRQVTLLNRDSAWWKWGGNSMFRLTAGETWLEGLELLDPDDGTLNYGHALFVNRQAQ